MRRPSLVAGVPVHSGLPALVKWEEHDQQTLSEILSGTQISIRGK